MRQRTGIGAETGRGIHYAQQYFVNASAVERVELRTARSHFVNFEEAPRNIDMKFLRLGWKYVYTLEGRGFVIASPLWQTELHTRMSQTNGDSTIFGTDVTSTRTFLKIYLEYVAFQAAPNRHVRQTIGIVDAAQRCKI